MSRGRSDVAGPLAMYRRSRTERAAGRLRSVGVVEIRADRFKAIDGLMLEHGLKGRHGQRPVASANVRAERPDTELLEERYTRFRAAG